LNEYNPLDIPLSRLVRNVMNWVRREMQIEFSVVLGDEGFRLLDSCAE
jgi:hypothetical protein